MLNRGENEKMSIITDYLGNIGLDVIKEKIGDEVIRKQAHERLTVYISRQKKLNNLISKDEELDFEALANYIHSDLMDDMTKYLFGKGSERKNARKQIIDKSISYANANTKLSIDRTKKIVYSAMDILSNYYKSKMNRDLSFAVSEIQETVILEGTERRNDFNKLDKKLDDITKQLNNCGLLSMEQSVSQIRKGNYKEIENRFAKTMEEIGKYHPLYPHYQFVLNSNLKFISQPLDKKAAQLYPQNIKIKLSGVRIGQCQIKQFDEKIFDLAYRHQKNLYINVEMAEQYLGAVKDPSQIIADELKGKEIILIPPEFPPAFPCYVTANEKIIVPYLLLRTTEIQDDGKVVITNDEQNNYPYSVKLVLDISNCKANYKISNNSDKNIDKLNYLKLIKRIKNGEKISVLLSENKKVLTSVSVEYYEYEMLDESIAFLESIVKIEKYFSINIDIPEKISSKDHDNIAQICALIDGEFSGNWSFLECYIMISDVVKENFNRLDNNEISIQHISFFEWQLFDQVIKLPVVLSLKSSLIQNFEKMINKINICDSNDKIKIVFIPSDKNDKFTENIYKGEINEDNGTLFIN